MHETEWHTREPLLSVIVPVYNVEFYLNTCIESIRSQTYQNLEIILVDDGSPDLCPSICDKFAEMDPRIKVIHKSNGGLSSARNAGLDLSHGDYIGFVDSDDWIAPDMYSTLMELMLKHHADLAECGIRFVYGSEIRNIENDCTEITVLDHLEATESFLDRSVPISASVCGKLYHKNIVENLRFPEGRLHEDAYFTYQAIFFSTVYVRTECCKYNYRQQRSGSIMTVPTNVKNITDVLDAFEERNSFFQRRGLTVLYEKSKAYYLQTLLGYYIEANLKLPGEKELIRSLKRKLTNEKKEAAALLRGVRRKTKYLVFLLCPKLLVMIYRVKGMKPWGKRSL